jgi:hypothetical protein
MSKPKNKHQSRTLEELLHLAAVLKAEGLIPIREALEEAIRQVYPEMPPMQRRKAVRGILKFQ